MSDTMNVGLGGADISPRDDSPPVPPGRESELTAEIRAYIAEACAGLDEIARVYRRGI
jgi:hypothetical protein